MYDAASKWQEGVRALFRQPVKPCPQRMFHALSAHAQQSRPGEPTIEGAIPLLSRDFGHHKIGVADEGFIGDVGDSRPDGDMSAVIA